MHPFHYITLKDPVSLTLAGAPGRIARVVSLRTFRASFFTDSARREIRVHIPPLRPLVIWPSSHFAAHAADTIEQLIERLDEVLGDDVPHSLQIMADGTFEVPLPPAVPQALANWRVKAVLDMHGLTGAVEAAIGVIPDGPDKIVISRAWQGNGDVFRNSPTVGSLMAGLNLTDAQVDEMFILGASFNP